MADHTSAQKARIDLDGDVVQTLQAVWADALGVEEVDPDAGFFDLGATSDLTLGVVLVLRRRWPRLRVVDVFSHPTIGLLAEFLGDE
jgi:hypothetical protein